MLCPRVNVGCGPAEERVLLTGLHAVADIYCENCKTTLGWKYVSIGVPAFASGQLCSSSGGWKDHFGSPKYNFICNHFPSALCVLHLKNQL